MNLRKVIPLLALAIICSVANASDSRFASRVVSYSNLASGVYGDPNAVLGKPTTYIYDSWSKVNFTTSLVYGAWNTAPDGTKLIVTVNSGGYITVEFDDPIYDDPGNLYGKDFIVFGNAAFNGTGTVTPTTNMETYALGNGSIREESATVSVSQDGLNWYTYSSPLADNYYPTNPFEWDRATDSWGAELDWTKPVNPSLAKASFSGLSAAAAIDLYDGSAGGTAFDLSASGMSWIKYIKVTGSGVEVDGFSRVVAAPVPEPGTLLALGSGALGLVGLAYRRRK
ncbi:MAG: PEP-CTERM sorting domain-containing protein [Armatimonadota bacterium]